MTKEETVYADALNEFGSDITDNGDEAEILRRLHDKAEESAR